MGELLLHLPPRTFASTHFSAPFSAPFSVPFSAPVHALVHAYSLSSSPRDGREGRRVRRGQEVGLRRVRAFTGEIPPAGIGLQMRGDRRADRGCLATQEFFVSETTENHRNPVADTVVMRDDRRQPG